MARLLTFPAGVSIRAIAGDVELGAYVTIATKSVASTFLSYCRRDGLHIVLITPLASCKDVTGLAVVPAVGVSKRASESG